MSGVQPGRRRLRRAQEHRAQLDIHGATTRMARALIDAVTHSRPASTRATKVARTDATLIGLDVARSPIRLRSSSWVPLAAAAVLGSLLLAALRMDVIRIRFGLAENLARELRLEDEKRELTVTMRRLRDPAVLSVRARELGFKDVHQIDLNRLEARPGAPIPRFEEGPEDGGQTGAFGIEFASIDHSAQRGQP